MYAVRVFRGFGFLYLADSFNGGYTLAYEDDAATYPTEEIANNMADVARELYAQDLGVSVVKLEWREAA